MYLHAILNFLSKSFLFTFIYIIVESIVTFVLFFSNCAYYNYFYHNYNNKFLCVPLFDIISFFYIVGSLVIYIYIGKTC